MSTWQEIETEISQSRDPDAVRKQKLIRLSEVTSRPVLLYAVDMYNTAKITAGNGAVDISINLSDKDAFTEALRGVEGDCLDVILHSPGGSPVATESLVKLLRTKFKSINFIIPSVAKSAATMLAMAGNEIILGENAELGPTDPQMIISGNVGPAHAIIAQFEKAKKELSLDSRSMPAWLPILQQYGTSLLAQCDDAIKLTKSLVTEWLGEYMLKGQKNAKQKASKISAYLAGKNHLSHARAISVDQLKSRGVNIKLASEFSLEFQDAIQDLYIALMITFNITGAYKICESSSGKGFYRGITVINVPQGLFPQIPK